MSKENNLKDYLTDLYEGIASKKADASRNPQNFRSEIESIETGVGNATAIISNGSTITVETAPVTEDGENTINIGG